MDQRVAALKNLSSAPLLVKPLDGEPLLLYLLISSNVVNVVLAKDLNGDQHPIYYISKGLLDLETRYSHLKTNTCINNFFHKTKTLF